MTTRKTCLILLALLGGIALAACGPVKAKTITCDDPNACGPYGHCDDSSGTAQCICSQGYTGYTCNLCASGYERDGTGKCVEVVTCESYCAARGRHCASVQGGDITCGACLPGWFEEDGRCYEACDAITVPGQLVPLDVFILLDRSTSMRDDGKWTKLVSAFNTFVDSSDTAGMGVGLQFFPVDPTGPIPGSCSSDADCGLYGPCLPMMNVCGGSMASDTSCDPADYTTPAVPIAELPGVASAIKGALSGTGADGSATPIQPAMEGVAPYVAAHAEANPTHLVYLLLAADGEPTGCSYNSTGAAADAAATLLADNEVPTYVFGVEDAEGDLDNLNDIAQAGGTGSAIMVDSSGSVTQTFIDTLNDIRQNAACKYRIPEPDQGNVDTNLINVSTVDPQNPSDSETVFNVISAEGCDASGGWHYDDRHNPTMILLCPATCEYVRQTQRDVVILMGCTTIVK